MSRSHCSPVRALVILALVSMVLPSLSGTEARAQGAPSAAARRVRDAVAANFRVLPIRGGIVLVPLQALEGVDNVELRDGTIAINGRVATGGEVRDRLGRHASAVIELSYMELADQQRLFELGVARTGRTQTPEEPARRTEEPTPPPAPTVRPDDQASTDSMARERRFRRQSEGRVRLGGDIVVEEDEEIDGPVVAIGGTVRVDGRVRAEVVAIGGDIHIGPRADIRGDVTSVGGGLYRAAGAQVRGHVNEIGVSLPDLRFNPFSGWHLPWVPWWTDGAWRSFRLFGTVLRMGLVALFATIVLLLLPRPISRIDHAVRTQPLKSALVGLFAQLLFVPALVIGIVLLTVSIIGIPLLIFVPFVILGFLVLLLLGFTGVATSVTRLTHHRLGWSPVHNPLSRLIVGLLLIWGLTMLGRIAGLGFGPLSFVGALLVFAGFVVEYVAWTMGLGGAIITRFGRFGPEAVTVPPVPSPSDGGPAATNPNQPLDAQFPEDPRL